MNIIKQKQTAELAKVIDRFFELKSEYSGSFWDSMQFAEWMMGRLDEVESQEMEQIQVPF